MLEREGRGEEDAERAHEAARVERREEVAPQRPEEEERHHPARQAPLGQHRVERLRRREEQRGERQRVRDVRQRRVTRVQPPADFDQPPARREHHEQRRKDERHERRRDELKRARLRADAQTAQQRDRQQQRRQQNVAHERAVSRSVVGHRKSRVGRPHFRSRKTLSGLKSSRVRARPPSNSAFSSAAVCILSSGSSTVSAPPGASEMAWLTASKP